MKQTPAPRKISEAIIHSGFLPHMRKPQKMKKQPLPRYGRSGRPRAASRNHTAISQACPRRPELSVAACVPTRRPPAACVGRAPKSILRPDARAEILSRVGTYQNFRAVRPNPWSHLITSREFLTRVAKLEQSFCQAASARESPTATPPPTAQPTHAHLRAAENHR